MATEDLPIVACAVLSAHNGALFQRGYQGQDYGSRVHTDPSLVGVYLVALHHHFLEIIPVHVARYVCLGTRLEGMNRWCVTSFHRTPRNYRAVELRATISGTALRSRGKGLAAPVNSTAVIRMSIAEASRSGQLRGSLAAP